MNNQTLNYSFSCIENIKSMFSEYGVLDQCNDLKSLLSILDKSVKFMLPNKGELIEEFEPGSIKEEWKDLMFLPFDMVAFEYPFENDNASRRITLLFNLRSDDADIQNIVNSSEDSHKRFKQESELKKRMSEDGEGRFYGLASFFYSESGHWECPPIGMALMVDSKESAGVMTESLILNEFLIKEAVIAEKRTFNQIFKQIVDDCSYDLWVAMQAMCVLNCENIKHIDIKVPEKLAKSRVKKGLKPLHDYKVLSINAGGSYESLFGGVSIGGSKRAHLRRGHLRRLRSGNVTYVRSTVVGAVGSSGFIEKDYRINKQN